MTTTKDPETKGRHRSILKLYDAGAMPMDIHRDTGISIAQVYRVITKARGSVKKGQVGE